MEPTIDNVIWYIQQYRNTLAVEEIVSGTQQGSEAVETLLKTLIWQFHLHGFTHERDMDEILELVESLR
jgi:hypothetical protein